MTIQEGTWSAILAAANNTMDQFLHQAAFYRSEFLRSKFAVHDTLAQEYERKAAALSTEIRALEELLTRSGR